MGAPPVCNVVVHACRRCAQIADQGPVAARLRHARGEARRQRIRDRLVKHAICYMTFESTRIAHAAQKSEDAARGDFVTPILQSNRDQRSTPPLAFPRPVDGVPAPASARRPAHCDWSRRRHHLVECGLQPASTAASVSSLRSQRVSARPGTTRINGGSGDARAELATPRTTSVSRIVTRREISEAPVANVCEKAVTYTQLK